MSFASAIPSSSDSKITIGATGPKISCFKIELYLSIVIFDTDEEGIALANDTEFGLISYVFSGELGRAIRTAEAMESGMVAINKGVISDPAAPFGGVKQSGLGREGGFDGIHEFLETKYIGFEL